MTIEKGSLKDWDDRHYQSIDDLPPEAWDAVRDDAIRPDFGDAHKLATIIMGMKKINARTMDIVAAIQGAGFKRD